jgi:hypothetical protein
MEERTCVTPTRRRMSAKSMTGTVSVPSISKHTPRTMRLPLAATAPGGAGLLAGVVVEAMLPPLPPVAAEAPKALRIGAVGVLLPVDVLLLMLPKILEESRPRRGASSASRFMKTGSMQQSSAKTGGGE